MIKVQEHKTEGEDGDRGRKDREAAIDLRGRREGRDGQLSKRKRNKNGTRQNMKEEGKITWS